VLGKLARQHDPNVLVGFDRADDAGVYLLAPDTALVQTVDFFTPIVDDPFTFGQIAATNSLSDVYAMGGRPITALALVCFPEKADLEILGQILAGGLSKMIEAGCTVIGGHSIRDDETKFGYSVTGLVDPARVLKNGGAQAGDRLIFTKALGTGVIATAIKQGVAKQNWIDAAVASMTTLNKTAAEVITSFDHSHPSKTAKGGAPAAEAVAKSHVGAGLQSRPAERSSAPAADLAHDGRRTPDDEFPVHALTDVTGFGLIGHLREMLLASDGVSVHLNAANIPLLEGALDCIRAGYIPAGLKANRDFAECIVSYEGNIPDEIKTILFDPQTAGGLLAAVAPDSAKAMLRDLRDAGVSAQEIGEVSAAQKAEIHVAV
jgi:selenide,water dikinase